MKIETSPDDLFVAAAAGDIPKVKQALAVGVNIDAVDSRGWTAAMWAAHNLQFGVMKLLNKLGADLSIRNPINYDAGDIAAKKHIENEKVSEAIQTLVADNPHYDAMQAEYAARAYALADKLKNLLGGRISRAIVFYSHNDWLLKTKFEGMRCEFYVFAGGFDLLIRGFPRKKFHAFFNLKGQDNLNAPEPEDKLLISEVFSPAYQAYSVRKPVQYEQAREFAANEKVHASIIGLHLGRYEWLIISGGQIRLRNQSEDLEFIILRLKHLFCIFETALPENPTNNCYPI